MAIINAANNGNWSNSSTWPSGVFPTVLDDVYANNKTIYIDQDISVYSLNTTAGAGGVAGGRFYANQGDRTINANIIQAGTTYCVTVTGTGTRTISSQFIEASDTTTTTAAVLIQGTTTALPNVITYGNLVGGAVAGSTNTNTIAAVTLEGGMLTHYGFISGGTAIRNTGLKIYQVANSTIPVSAIIYGNVKGGTQSIAPGIICEFSPNISILPSCIISVYGNVSGGDSLLTSSVNSGLYNSTTIHTDVFGNIYGGSNYTVQAGGLVAAGSVVVDINIVGNVYNNLYGWGSGVYYTSTSGNVNLTGNVISLDTVGISPAGNSNVNSAVIYQNGGTNLNILGDVYGCRGSRGYFNYGIYLDSTCTVNITGNIYGGNTGGAYGIYCADSPNIVNVYGNVYGNVLEKSVGNHGIYNNTTATINIYGSAVASEKDNGSHGVFNASTGIVYAKKAVANSFGLGSNGMFDAQNYGIFSNNISGRNFVEELVFGSRGQIPVFGPTYIVKTTTNKATVQKSQPDIGATYLGPKSLVDNTVTSTFLPATSDVKIGVVYNNLTGTMIVPSTSSVSFGISVDNSKGTAYLTPDEIWNTQTTKLTSLSSTIGYRLNNSATVEFIGNALAAYNI